VPWLCGLVYTWIGWASDERIRLIKKRVANNIAEEIFSKGREVSIREYEFKTKTFYTFPWQQSG
jgi:hypothetical protein